MRLAPRAPSRSEELLLRAQKILLEQPDGLYPYFGSVYSGGGFTLGAGYRRFTGDRTNWNVAGLYSAKNYKLLEGGVASPGHASGKIGVRASAGWRDATQVSFYGLGNESAKAGLSTFHMQQAFAGGNLTLRPLRRIYISAGATYEDYTLKSAPGDLVSIEDVYTPSTAPGLGENPTYIHTTISAGVDWRPAADYARRGGLYEVALHRYSDRAEVYSFDRLDAQVVQHLPILRENWVVSLRGQLQTTLGDADQVPYFLLPSLGSGSTLRAYSSWRFRDRHSLLFSGEWRWIAEPPCGRHGLLLRRGHGGQSARGHLGRRSHYRHRSGHPVSWSCGHSLADRTGEGTRGRASCLRRQCGILRMFRMHIRPLSAFALCGAWPSSSRLRCRPARAAASTTTTRSPASPKRRMHRAYRSGRSICSSISRQISSVVLAIPHRTFRRAMSTRLTKCRIRAGSPTASSPIL